MILRWSRFGLPRRLPLAPAAVFAVWSLVLLWAFLPYDHPILLAARFLSQKALIVLGLTSSDACLFGPAKFPVSLDRDVAFIIKTGYGTQTRVPALLDALDLMPEKGSAGADFLVIADFSTDLLHNGHAIRIEDSIAPLARSEALSRFSGSGRLVKYRNMTDAIRKGRADEADRLAKSLGWELDALKFIPGLDLAYKRFPDKKWYILLDDDTYLVKPSVLAILGQLDPSKPKYLGNAVGDFKGRFAHGGSSIILSHAALKRLFPGDDSDDEEEQEEDETDAVVATAYLGSLEETWGDKLVATTLMKLGIYLDERFSRHFNGEPPHMTRIRADRFCTPIASFHGLADARLMREVGDKFRGLDDKPVVWGRVWELYTQPSFGEFETANQPVRAGLDYVGRVDEAIMTVASVTSAEHCRQTCANSRLRTCLAWTWEEATGKCNVSPWMTIGVKAEGKFSGLDAARAEKLAGGCGRLR